MGEPQFTVRVPNEWTDGVDSTSIDELMDAILATIQMSMEEGQSEDTLICMQYRGVLARLEKDERGYVFRKV